MQRHDWVPATRRLVRPVGPGDHRRRGRRRHHRRSDGQPAGHERDDQDSLAAFKTWTTLAGAILTLAIVAMTVGLVRGEGAADLRTLTATGAAPRTRRALSAATATALALLGSMLGIGGAYIVLVASYRTTLDVLAPPPLPQLATLTISLPLVACRAGWLLAGREPAAFPQRPTLD